MCMNIARMRYHSAKSTRVHRLLYTNLASTRRPVLSDSTQRLMLDSVQCSLSWGDCVRTWQLPDVQSCLTVHWGIDVGECTVKSVRVTRVQVFLYEFSCIYHWDWSVTVYNIQCSLNCTSYCVWTWHSVEHWDWWWTVYTVQCSLYCPMYRLLCTNLASTRRPVFVYEPWI